MKFIDIYLRNIGHWGNEIVFSDGAVFGQDGFSSHLFIGQWIQIEALVGEENTYDELMVWTMYQTFHGHALELFKKGIYSFYPKDINKQEIEQKYFENLNNEGFETELKNYNRTLD